jgi:quinol monooxygenase YgiN
MIVLLATYHVKRGNMEDVIAALQKMTSLVKEREADCVLFQVARSQDNPDELKLYEVYVDQEAVKVHREMPHYQEYIVETVIPMLEKREVAFYDLVIG